MDLEKRWVGMCVTSGATLTGKATHTLWSLFTEAIEATKSLTLRASRSSGRSVALSFDEEGDARIASVALLLEVAHADGRFSRQEQSVVEDALRREFGLVGPQACRLVEAAERARDRAPGPWPFANVLVDAYSEEQRRTLADILNRLALADDGPTWREQFVIGQLSSLLRVEASHV